MKMSSSVVLRPQNNQSTSSARISKRDTKKGGGFVGLLSAKMQRRKKEPENIQAQEELEREKIRRQELDQKKKERRLKLRDDNYLKDNRERMMRNVC